MGWVSGPELMVNRCKAPFTWNEQCKELKVQLALRRREEKMLLLTLSHPSRMGQRRVQADPKDLGASFFLDSSWALVPGIAYH